MSPIWLRFLVNFGKMQNVQVLNDCLKSIIPITYAALIALAQALTLFIVSDIRSRVSRLESMHLEAKK